MFDRIAVLVVPVLAVVCFAILLTISLYCYYIYRNRKEQKEVDLLFKQPETIEKPKHSKIVIEERRWKK